MEDKLKHRKARAVVRVMRADGTPVCGESIVFNQISHDFLFGCGAFQTLELTGAGDGKTRKFYEDRMEKWLSLFNYGTLPFYWQRFEQEPGRTQTEELMRAALWLKERGVQRKGHPLCWHTQTAPWLLELEPEEVLRQQLDRIEREVTGFRGIIDIWDVINEVVIMPVFDKYENGITRLCKKLGQEELVKLVFDRARACNPAACLLLNDFNTSVEYERLIEQCLDAGVSVDAIGIQSHQHQGYWGKEKLLSVLDRFSRFGLPVHFTENTFISGELMPPEIVDLNDYHVDQWPSTAEGEARQAADAEEFYRILFEDANVEAVTTWAFQDGAWLGAPAGLVDKNNGEKPAYGRLKQLIWGEWKTVSPAVTDDHGCVDLYGFKGEYEAVVLNQKHNISLLEDTKEAIITVRQQQKA